ncbi:helix-turn-helix transcriptional regulator [Saccharopolyspora shandongensis]|uniref:helix-turn-helix transcriptional regulator n=1 Tax=Saccharopolyspora shandongensis TaxID=418495 RepID=UPI0033E26C65
MASQRCHFAASRRAGAANCTSQRPAIVLLNGVADGQPFGRVNSSRQHANRDTDPSPQPHTHITPLTYLTWWRMTKAAELLRRSDASVRTIGQEVGYTSESAFAKVFKREYGIAPRSYRREQAAQPTIEAVSLACDASPTRVRTLATRGVPGDRTLNPRISAWERARPEAEEGPLSLSGKKFHQRRAPGSGEVPAIS